MNNQDVRNDDLKISKLFYVSEVVSININTAINTLSNINIYNINGQPILTQSQIELHKGLNQHNIELGNVSSGTYFIQISTSEGITTQKFVVTN